MHVIAGLAINPPLYIRSVVRERDLEHYINLTKAKTKPTLDEGNDEIEDLRVDEEKEDVGELEEVAGEERGGERLDESRGDPWRRLVAFQHLQFDAYCINGKIHGKIMFRVVLKNFIFKRKCFISSYPRS